VNRTANHEPPAPLDAQAQAKWAELLPILEARGDVDGGILDGLACYCQAWARWAAAEAEVAKLGTVVKSPIGTPVENPYLRIAAAAQRQLRQWGNELGLTPAARKKVSKHKTVEAEPSNLLAELLAPVHRRKPATTN
jgi:P27 family predicted phage terminase small subunit